MWILAAFSDGFGSQSGFYTLIPLLWGRPDREEFRYFRAPQHPPNLSPTLYQVSLGNESDIRNIKLQSTVFVCHLALEKDILCQKHTFQSNSASTFQISTGSWGAWSSANVDQGNNGTVNHMKLHATWVITLHALVSEGQLGSVYSRKYIYKSCIRTQDGTVNI